MGLLKAVGSLLGGDTIKDVGNIIDNLHTSDEEKAEARQKIEQLLVDAELLITVYGAYFAGRSIEKVRKVTK